MTSLAAIRKQIAALEAEAARITKAEMSAAIAKIKELMETFGLTAEHIGLTATRKRMGAAKKSVSRKTSAGRAKYADPQTGKTWSGFGRAPAWIAAVKNRDDFLVDKREAQVAKAATRAPVASKKVAKPVRKATKGAVKSSAKKTART